MENTYKATSALGEHHFGSEPFERQFTPAEEQDWLVGGHIEQVPRTYRVLVDNYAVGTQGEEVELSLLAEHEAMLLSGGVLERVDKTGEYAEEALDGTVEEVTEWVGDDPKRAQAVLDRETGEDGKNRKGVIEAATAVLDAQPDPEEKE
jgi:hypothetical protein